MGGTATMAIAPQVLAELCNVVSDPRRLERPLEMPAALELCEPRWSAQECRPVTVDSEVGALFLAWMHELRLGRKQLLDTLLAASHHRASVRRLATPGWRDFARYGVFEIETFQLTASEPGDDRDRRRMADDRRESRPDTGRAGPAP